MKSTLEQRKGRIVVERMTVYGKPMFRAQAYDPKGHAIGEAGCGIGETEEGAVRNIRSQMHGLKEQHRSEVERLRAQIDILGAISATEPLREA